MVKQEISFRILVHGWSIYNIAIFVEFCNFISLCKEFASALSYLFPLSRLDWSSSCLIVAMFHTFSMVIVVSGLLFTLFANSNTHGNKKEKLIDKNKKNNSYGS